MPNAEPQSPGHLLILGAGYTGRVLLDLATAEGLQVWASSRHPRDTFANLSGVTPLTFNLTVPETWSRVPDGVEAVWLFPAEPLDQVIRFVESCGTRIHRLVVMGSTSAYDNAPEVARGEWVTESSALDRRLPRVQGEEFLRDRLGAIVLRAAGIYGPGRNPLEWIRQGRVRWSPRYVNVIHVMDLARICLVALNRAAAGDTFLVSDGTPRRWSDIIEQAITRWGVPRPPEDRSPRPGKRIDTTKLRDALGYTVKHPDLFAVIEEFERTKDRSSTFDAGSDPF